MGYWKYQVHYWNTWSGRYVGTLISATQPLAYGSHLGYKLLPILIFVAYAHAAYTFMKSVLSPWLPLWKPLFLAFLFLFIFIAEIPTVAGYFYWYTGYYYTIADICTLYLFSYFFKNYDRRDFTKTAIICISLVLIIGMNEYSLVWLVSLTGALFVFGSFVQKKLLVHEMIIFVVALAAGILSITAPGNAVRADSGLYPTPLKYNLIYSLQHSVVWAIHNFAKMAPTLFIYAIVLMPIAAQLYKVTPKDKLSFLDIHPLLSCFVFFGCLYITYFPTYWSIAEPPNLRGQGLITFWTLLGWTFNIFVITFWILKRYHQITVPRLGIFSWAIGFYFLSIYLSNFNFRSALSDLATGRAARYNQEMQNRTKMVLSTKEREVTVPKLVNIPYTILNPNDITDPAWASVEYDNGCAEWYFKKKFFYK